VTATATHSSRISNAPLPRRYVLERRLGRGGMGVVYLAASCRLDRRVAIKLLRPNGPSQPGRGALPARARTAAQLSHPGIVPIFAVHEVSDFVYFAMAYGTETRSGGCPRRGPLRMETAAGAREVARALGLRATTGRGHRYCKARQLLLDLATGARWSPTSASRASARASHGAPRVVGTAEFMSRSRCWASAWTRAATCIRSAWWVLRIIG